MTAAGRRALSLAAFALLWVGLAWWSADTRILPQPWALVPAFADQMASGDLPYHLWRTLVRVAWAMGLAMALGVAIGLWMGTDRRVDDWLDPWLTIFLNLPALVLIVLCYLWIGLNETAAIAAVTLNKVPNVVTVVREGARALDPDLSAMGRVYRMGAVARLRHVVLPQMAPYLTAALRGGLAVVWKIVLVVEFLGRSNGIGFKIHSYFQLWRVDLVLVYALAFVAVMLLVEAMVLRPAELRVRRWRGAVA